MSDRAKAGMGGGRGKSSKSAARPSEMHIKRGHTGGFIVTHHHKHPAAEPSTHAVQDTEQLLQHVQDNMGDQPPTGSAPAPAAPPQMPPQGM